ncbi:hypothetical protein Taro_039540 [Colocasia esculenta]|uniref:Uncharacterized protein n=1 Tax=Colocasia esculenta TaxID=4460 RepID=A0A843WRU1_COLES|nr:hypothetical protein [Colocasia esculenta]
MPLGASYQLARELAEEYLEHQRRRRSPNWSFLPQTPFCFVCRRLFLGTPKGLLFQLLVKSRVVEFGNMSTSGITIMVHNIILFCIFTILVVAIGVHVHALTT